MKRALASAIACMALAIAASAVAPAAVLASGCSRLAPSRLALTRLAGQRARLSWRVPSGLATDAPLDYRVLRAGRVVGQTTSGAMVLRVTPGRVTTFTVQARYAGAPSMCAANLRTRVKFRLPGAVPKLRVIKHTSGGVLIGWSSAARGDAPVVGYRILRDSAVVGQTHGRTYTLRLSAGRSHRVNVLAVDSRGHLGPRGRTLVISVAGTQVSSGGPGPSTPAGLSVSEVSEQGATIWWQPSNAGSARVVGYRVYRDGSVVGQTSATTMRLSHLSSLHTYLIAVSAIDADKRESARTAPLSLTTTHLPPDGPALLSAVRVTDTSATLSWQAGSANSGTLVGYELFQDGVEVGVVHGQITTVKLASDRQYVFTVRALDSLGYLSAPAPNLTVVTTHTPPPAPTGLTATNVTSGAATVSWTPSTAVSGQIVGYRVFRDEIPVGQTSATEMTLQSLAPSSQYDVTVVAVDSLGAISQPTAPLAIQTAAPTPTHGSAQAFLLASTDQSFYDLESHYQQIGVVYPTYFECGAGGEVQGKDDGLETSWAQAREIAVMPRLNCQNPNDEDQILNEPAVREKTIEQLTALCRSYGYQGVQIDFEGAAPSERTPFTEFITILAERLHAQGDKLSTIVTAKYYNIQSGRAAMYDDAALSAVSDYILVLDWGVHWTTSGPGSIDEMPWFKRVAEYTATMPNLSKFVLGMPMYGIDWPSGGGAGNPGTPLEYSNVMALAAEYGVTPEWEPTSDSPHFSYTDASGVRHEVWYTDQQSIGMRVALAESLGLKVGLWRLGEEDQSVWELSGLGG